MFSDKMDSFIQRYCEENPFSGSLRITVKDEIIYSRSMGLANYETGMPFTDDSMFTFYSLSKPFCAIGLLKLCDKGLVDLNAHPAKYLPEAEGFDKRVKICHMLQHVSGIPDCYITEGFREKYSPGHAETMREQVKRVSRYPQVFVPGTKAQYANINYTLSALIIENVSGQSYSEYMKKEVFEPLGMKSALVDSKELLLATRVQGYELKDGKKTAADRSLEWMLGGGDIIGTVDDVYCLNRAIKQKLLLKSETWDKVLTPSPLNDMGFGCTVKYRNGRLRITHNGGHVGFRTYHIQLPEDDVDIILLSNCGWGDARKEFEEQFYKLYYGDKSIDNDFIQMDKGYI